MFADNFLATRFGAASKKPRSDFIEQLKNCDREKFNRIHSNTTVFALIYNGGVLIAGDRRTSGGYFEIVSDETNKVLQISKYSAMAAAGFCNVISDLEDNLSSVCRSFENLYGQELSPDGQANFLKKLLEPWWFTSVYSWYWMVGIPILAVYDVIEDVPRIFVFDETGYYYEPGFLGGTGCGYESISGLLKNLWRQDMTEEGAIILAMQAMLQSGAASSGVSDARLYLPTVGVIDSNGFRFIPDEILDVTRKELLKITENLK